MAMSSRTPSTTRDQIDLDALQSRFNFQAQMLSAYLREALPEHTTRQAQILLQNLVRTGHQTIEQVS